MNFFVHLIWYNLLIPIQNKRKLDKKKIRKQKTRHVPPSKSLSEKNYDIKKLMRSFGLPYMMFLMWN